MSLRFNVLSKIWIGITNKSVSKSLEFGVLARQLDQLLCANTSLSPHHHKQHHIAAIANDKILIFRVEWTLSHEVFSVMLGEASLQQNRHPWTFHQQFARQNVMRWMLKVSGTWDDGTMWWGDVGKGWLVEKLFRFFLKELIDHIFGMVSNVELLILIKHILQFEIRNAS